VWSSASLIHSELLALVGYFSVGLRLPAIFLWGLSCSKLRASGTRKASETHGHMYLEDIDLYTCVSSRRPRTCGSAFLNLTWNMNYRHSEISTVLRCVLIKSAGHKATPPPHVLSIFIFLILPMNRQSLQALLSLCDGQKKDVFKYDDLKEALRF